MVAPVTRFLVVLSIAAWPATVHASPHDLFGFGGRSPGLGFTGLSYLDGYAAAYVNPAGLARAEQRGIFLGAQGMGFDVSIDGEDARIEPARGTTIGFHVPLPFGGAFEDRLVLGAAFFTPAESLLLGEVRFPEVPQFPVLTRGQAAGVHVALGLDLDGVVDGLRIGGGVAVTANLIGDLTVFLDDTSAFASKVETQLLADYAPVIGASYDYGDFSAGLVWRYELSAVVQLDVESMNLPVMLPTLRVGGLVEFVPHEIGAEVSYVFFDELRVIAGAELALWSAYEGAQQRTTDTSILAPDPEFSTTLSPRVAVEWTSVSERRRTSFSARGGYLYEPTPAPPAAMRSTRDRNGAPTGALVPLRILDNDRHVFTAGVGFAHTLSGGQKISLDLYGQLHWLPPLEHEVPAPGGAAPMETGGAILGGGWELGVHF
jgi:long-chain fatty acid transport protein